MIHKRFSLPTDVEFKDKCLVVILPFINWYVVDVLYTAENFKIYVVAYIEQTNPYKQL